MSAKTKRNPLLTVFANNGHHFPAVWEYMLPEEFSYLHVPAERMLDCANCNMVHTDGYSKDIKCCSYFPQIPNYMLGLALKDPSARKLVERVIADGHALPEGTVQTQSALRMATREYVEDRFGKSRRLRCPFLNETGECGIYAYRGVVCATFYCQNDHGDVGDRYWDTFQNAVRQVEVILLQSAMTDAGLGSKAYHEQLDSMVDRIGEMTDPQTDGAALWVRKQLFGKFFGKETEFFEACADFVIANKDRLYDIACAQDSTTMAFKYEKALEDGLTDSQRKEIQCLPETMGDIVPAGALWYKLQVATRRLWEIPFNEGTVVLNPQASINENPKNDTLSQLHGDRPMVLALPGKTDASEPQRFFLHQEETNILNLFLKPVVIGETLFEKPAIANFAAARDFIAECLRKSILIVGTED